jgi:anti-sigma factor RsiW
MLHPEDGILHAYLDGECSELEMSEIEEHLDSCAECRARLEEAKGLGLEAGVLLGELEPVSIQAPPWHELEQLAAERQRASSQADELDSGESATVDSASPFWRMPNLAWAASLVVAFGLGWMVSTDWSGLALEPEAVSLRDLQAPSEIPATTSEELDAAEREFEPRVSEFRANSPATGAAEDQPRGDRDTEGLVATDELAQTAAGEGKAVERAAGQEEAVPLRSPAPETQVAAQPPAEPPADPAKVVGAVSKDESAAARRPAEAPEQARVTQAFAARKKTDTASTSRARTQQADPATSAAPDARQQSVVAEAEPGVALEENLAAGTGGYRAFLDDFAAPITDDDSRPVSAVGFVSVSPESAEAWLGVPLRTLPDLTLLRVEVGPGSVVDTAIAGRPLVALFYEDAAGQRVTLIQQHSDGSASGMDTLRRSEAAPATIITPSGLLTYRWQDVDYHLTLIGELSSDALRALVDRVR